MPAASPTTIQVIETATVGKIELVPPNPTVFHIDDDGNRYADYEHLAVFMTDESCAARRFADYSAAFRAMFTISRASSMIRCRWVSSLKLSA